MMFDIDDDDVVHLIRHVSSVMMMMKCIVVRSDGGSDRYGMKSINKWLKRSVAAMQ